MEMLNLINPERKIHLPPRLWTTVLCEWTVFPGLLAGNSKRDLRGFVLCYLPSGNKADVICRVMLLEIKEMVLGWSPRGQSARKKELLAGTVSPDILPRSHCISVKVFTVGIDSCKLGWRLLEGAGNKVTSLSALEGRKVTKKKIPELTQWSGWCCGQNDPEQIGTRCWISQPRYPGKE